MIYSRIKKLVILLVLLTAGSSVGAQTDDKLPMVVPTIDGETYRKIVAQMFPLDALDAPDSEFTLVLRYSPTFENTRQIVIAARDEKIFVTEYVSNGDIEYKADEYLQRTGSEDASKIAQSIGVTKREFNIPAKIEQNWRADLIESVAKDVQSQQLAVKQKVDQRGVWTILLHGTTYELWYSSGGARMYFSEYGVKLNAPIYPDDSEFIRRMKLIYREIANFK